MTTLPVFLLLILFFSAGDGAQRLVCSRQSFPSITELYPQVPPLFLCWQFQSF